MSPKKITDADKLEIVDRYRQSGDTTASLASLYGVSNSTISRLLKTSIPETEYELLIQQKRGAKVGSEEDSLATTNIPMVVAPTVVTAEVEINYGTTQPSQIETQSRSKSSILPEQNLPSDRDKTDSESVDALMEPPHQITPTFQAQDDRLVTPPPIASMIEDRSTNKRLVRRRSSALADDSVESTVTTTPLPDLDLSAGAILTSPVFDTVPPPTPISTKAIIPPPVPRTPILRDDRPHAAEYFSDLAGGFSDPEVAADEQEEDTEPEDVSVLAAMFGEEITEGEDEEEFSDEEDWDEDSVTEARTIDRDRLLTSDRLHVRVTPLSQATLPRTCYIVIDKFAELIVRPLKDFADLGQIPTEEVQQRTLPIFDNHRVAKRFSNQRTQRVIKVPDSRVFHKTTHHLRSKGITRLLVDGNIYSLN